MEKEKIVEVLTPWNFWEGDQYTGTARDEYLKQLVEYSRQEEVVAIVGVRRAGKSYLMRQCIKELIKNGAKPEETLYINFEEPLFKNYLNLDFLVKCYEAYREIVNPEGYAFLFLDEIQNIPGWEKFVRGLMEKREAKLYVSGSSAQLLSAEFATVLAGRQITLEVYPLSFREFLTFRGVKIDSKLDVLKRSRRIRGYLREYLEYGGFPRVVLSEGNYKKEILKEYFNTILLRDIVLRFRVENVKQLEALAVYLLTNISNRITYNKLKNMLKFLGTKMSLDSVVRYMDFLKKAFFIFEVNAASYKAKEIIQKPRKVYAIDTGLRNTASVRFSEDIGRLAENAVFLELKRRGNDIYYYSKNKECDFVVKKDMKFIHALQVCWSVEEATKKREVNGLTEALEELHLRDGTIITGDYEDKVEVDGKNIFFIPMWKWLSLDKGSASQW